MSMTLQMKKQIHQKQIMSSEEVLRLRSRSQKTREADDELKRELEIRQLTGEARKRKEEGRQDEVRKREEARRRGRCTKDGGRDMENGEGARQEKRKQR